MIANPSHWRNFKIADNLTPQPAAGTQYYRLHPHLKRLLDASPYAHDNHPQWTVIPP